MERGFCVLCCWIGLVRCKSLRWSVNGCTLWFGAIMWSEIVTWVVVAFVLGIG